VRNGARVEHLRQHKTGAHGHRHPVNQIHIEEATLGQRLADGMSGTLGSWTFILCQTGFMVAWILFNLYAILGLHWDPYPFIFLNLVLSFQATYAGPILLLAANRQGQRDRLTLEHAEIEATTGDERLRTILIKIRENTRYTNEILEHLETGGAL